MCHVWTAPDWQGESSRRRLDRCSHLFGLLVRYTSPLAIMPSADQVPVNSTHSMMLWPGVGCPDRWGGGASTASTAKPSAGCKDTSPSGDTVTPINSLVAHLHGLLLTPDGVLRERAARLGY